MLTVQQLPGHPPLTSLRSFAPPYASEGGVGGGKSWQSFPHHGNHGSKPPPFAERKGDRGMLAFARTSITTSNMWYQLLQTRFRR